MTCDDENGPNVMAALFDADPDEAGVLAAPKDGAARA
jgi:hypothetical protein